MKQETIVRKNPTALVVGVCHTKEMPNYLVAEEGAVRQLG